MVKGALDKGALEDKVVELNDGLNGSINGSIRCEGAVVYKALDNDLNDCLTDNIRSEVLGGQTFIIDLFVIVIFAAAVTVVVVVILQVIKMEPGI